MTRRLAIAALFLIVVTISALPPRTASATALSVALDVQGEGLSAVVGGVGLDGIGAGSRDITVNIGGPVQGALLYWAGRDRPCPLSGGVCVIPFQPYKDQSLRFEGNLITGTIIGTEAQPASAAGPINNIGYLADVTSIVQAAGNGSQSFSIEDGDTASNLFSLSGASLVVIYTNPGDTVVRRLILYDGLDYAFGDDPTPGATRVTAPVTFNHGAVAGSRVASLWVIAGDAETARPDRIDISNNSSLVNTLDGSSGARWDSDQVAITVPTGVGSTSVQLFSEPAGQNPDSILWIASLLSIASAPDPDADGDGVPDSQDSCPGTTPGASVSPTGCSAAQAGAVDSDLDGVCNRGVVSDRCAGADLCPRTPPGSVVDSKGCSQAQVDSDGDGVCNRGITSTLCTGSDLCPRIPAGTANGCPSARHFSNLVTPGLA